MSGSGSQNLGFRLDIKQILSEAQHRWLRPAEICEILRNYQKFHITPEPPFKPASGSVFLFDRKVLRYFRKDGHNWRKKKDGKTVKEAHEKLKVGSIDMLHCYYAHGEENENFQRRSYWMLEQDLMHIVFVHYLEVKGNKTNINCLLDNEAVSSSSQNDSSLSLSSSANGDNLAAAYTDTTSPTSTLTSAYEEAECAPLNAEDRYQVTPRVHSYPGTLQQDSIHAAQHVDSGLSGSYGLLQSLGNQTIPSGEYMSFSLGHGGAESHGGAFISGIPRPLDLGSWEEVWRHSTTGDIAGEHQSWNPSELQANWQYTQGDCSSPFKALPEQNPISSSVSDSRGNFNRPVPENFQKLTDTFYLNADGQEKEPVVEDHEQLHSNAQIGFSQKDKAENGIGAIGTGNCPLVVKQPQLNGIQMDDGLKKVDSFSRWMAKELGEVEELHMQSNNGYSWSEIQTEDVVENPCMPTQLRLDADTLNFSLSQDQLFSITDFSPNWAYTNIGTKVIIIGRYLKPDQEFVRCRWSCMFGEVEVSAMVLGEGVLCCQAPPHKSGLVPFYVTCSNRLACSEIREFEYRAGPREIDFTDIPGGDMGSMHLLYKRLERLLSTGPVSNTNTSSENAMERNDMVKKIKSLMEEDEYQRTMLVAGNDISLPKGMEEQQVEKSLKEKFYEWLLQKVTEDGKGPSVLDDEGQGVLHLAAALGFNWALKPIIASGVSIDFRDVNGWTALHWAAFYGREDTVVALVSLGASCGALTDPSAEYPLGRAPADLASANGHKGISGFLAEGSLTSLLSLLTVKETEENNNTTGYAGAKAIQTVSERVAAPISEEDVPDSLSLKDSLAAVCNATQAAARIHQIFRVQSFQRKQLIEQVDDSSEEHALSILAAKASRLGQHDANAHAAAISIQKKYRGWKKRKEFLIIRERIVKIQAHVRGHQARKKYKPIIWSVGILEKVILRWRRKGSGLRGFRPDAVTKGPSEQEMPQKEDDYDFLKEGRKQAEERMQKALSRVKSMAQYPEARAQYRRLLTVAEGLRETKDATDMVQGDPEHTSYPEEDLFDVENLLDDDTFMSIAFE